ncbi:uncharacterized protein LOC125418197 isoform X1 [Ziziphus jujuba]|uniref:Uncharacterized protein LOC125418197 isoform X1 n=1 Tax=Ziziphus jujuba TaxID=326968 RepID=A0ABM3I4I5_ZIZJJ|nr:uncharacterized protein LOC125418197 isoform X1 [Ziziphus jujuba]
MEVMKEVENPPHLGIDSEKNKSIPELIMNLRTAFRTEDFDMVEGILVAKEAEMKLEIEKMKEEISLFQKERDFHSLEKIRYEKEFKASNERADKAKESYEKLLKKVKVNKRVEDNQTTIDELRKKNAELESLMNLAKEERDSHCIEKVKFETLFNDLNERAKEANERYEKRMEQVKNSYKTTIDELKEKNSELESEKKGAEEELNRWMSRYEQRVSRLEEDVKMLNSSNALERSGPVEVIEGNGDDDNGENGIGESVRLPSEEENVASNWNENARVEQNEVSAPSPLTEGEEGSGKFAPGDPILIADSDDDYMPVNNKGKSQNLADIEDSSMMGMERRRLLKRKRASSIDLCESESNKIHEDNTIPSHCSEKGIPSVANDVEELRRPLSQDQAILRGSEEKIATVPPFPTILNRFSGGRIDELVDIEESTSSSESDDTDSTSDADADINELLSKYQKTGENKRWASEADMVSAFEKDPELCLNAVCALYRQHKSVMESASPGVYPFSDDRGFKKFDAPRGIRLARFLIDEDPHGKLRRSVKELELQNRKGLSECRKLAVEHSKQLFKIYQNKEDPFFIPS